MKKVIFHIGYPKTATTTLQEMLQSYQGSTIYLPKDPNINKQTSAFHKDLDEIYNNNFQDNIKSHISLFSSIFEGGVKI